MKNLLAVIKKLESHIPQQERTDTNISKAPVGWHIQHSLLTITQIVENLKKSDPNAYQWKFSFLKVVVFTMKKIPRGRAQSPDTVMPKNIGTAETIKKEFDIALAAIKELDALNANNYFKHPVFGKMNVKPAIKFLEIHTRHHLNIINDIIKKGQ